MLMLADKHFNTHMHNKFQRQIDIYRNKEKKKKNWNNNQHFEHRIKVKKYLISNGII